MLFLLLVTISDVVSSILLVFDVIPEVNEEDDDDDEVVSFDCGKVCCSQLVATKETRHLNTFTKSIKVI